eukprot:gnl/TRDRNA2_/TRDRNA2_181378_c0_seq1.p1 gnl/TRDRNA2_/TRDRNA2_181378_c0~~gnl/TRDRNA2_/TRDRNA2_181378_c0_seq1.p1  ORF type:complete len:203 (+),score=40.95 gnl/TRDRNA2_/TRDRNA2_181378_c0_seq1:77-610(+)
MVALLIAGATATFKPCNRQTVFDVMMCDSYACNDCILPWCTEACQKIQVNFAGCRCQNWPDARKTFSGGDFAGKGGTTPNRGGYMSRQQLNRVKEKFASIDFHGDGKITKRELLSICDSQEQADEYWDLVMTHDADGDKELSLRESIGFFEDIIKRSHSNRDPPSELENAAKNKVAQ